MKALFLLFHGFEAHNGISKKIFSQIKAIKECGVNIESCYFDVDEKGFRRWMIGNNEIANFGNSFISKIKKRIIFEPIIKYVKDNDISFIYIRYNHNANPFTIRFVKQLNKLGIKTVLEIPTYPYDKEYINVRMKCRLFIDKCFRVKLAQYINYIITFSNHDTIFNQKTIRISNGIDFSAIQVKSHINNTSKQLNLIGVAEIHYWHGFDRVINGLAEYYKSNPKYMVFFHIIGDFSGDREKNEILNPILKNKLEKYIIIHGSQHGSKLDELFELADIGIGSLARHRCGISNIKTLKNREYAARGIPFIYSENDSDFDSMPYVLKVTADDSPINIESIIDFYRVNKYSPVQIRESINDLSWEKQMKNVIDNIII